MASLMVTDNYYSYYCYCSGYSWTFVVAFICVLLSDWIILFHLSFPEGTSQCQGPTSHFTDFTTKRAEEFSMTLKSLCHYKISGTKTVLIFFLPTKYFAFDLLSGQHKIFDIATLKDAPNQLFLWLCTPRYPYDTETFQLTVFYFENLLQITQFSAVSPVKKVTVKVRPFL